MTETAQLVPICQGTGIVYCTCSCCNQTMQYPTDKAYNFCPYCGKFVKHNSSFMIFKKFNNAGKERR